MAIKREVKKVTHGFIADELEKLTERVPVSMKTPGDTARFKECFKEAIAYHRNFAERISDEPADQISMEGIWGEPPTQEPT